jgi:23S rRNA (uracil1939-C5)-methyltransferase
MNDFPYPIHTGHPTGWRVRSKLAVRGKIGAPLIGLFKPGTHEVEALLDSPDHHPRINQAIRLVKDWMIRYRIEPYHEMQHRGQIRYIQCVVQRDTGKIQLACAVTHMKEMEGLLDHLIEDSPKDFWHSLWINHHPSRSNTIFSDQWILHSGEKWLWETIGNQPVCFLPGSFGQANLTMFERLLEKLGQWVNPESRVLELYAGVGVIGLASTKANQPLTLCENNPASLLCFEEMMRRKPREQISYHLKSAVDSIPYLKGFDLLIVDPPRKGLDLPLIKALSLPDGPSELIYVSCSYPSFCRDAQILEDQGWRMTHAEGYLFFPGTDHIELLAKFSV